jgi:hypothetical protein
VVTKSGKPAFTERQVWDYVFHDLRAGLARGEGGALSWLMAVAANGPEADLRRRAGRALRSPAALPALLAAVPRWREEAARSGGSPVSAMEADARAWQAERQALAEADLARDQRWMRRMLRLLGLEAGGLT